MKIIIWHHNDKYMEEQHIKILATLELPSNDISVHNDVLGSFLSLKPDRVVIEVCDIPARIDYDYKYRNLFIISSDRVKYHPTPRHLIDDGKGKTLWQYGEREEATEIETGDLSAISC